MRERILMAWSGGKDSALALNELRGRPEIEIVGLLTTITDPDDVISMHRVRRSLLEQQVRAIGLPLVPVRIPPACRNAVYEAAMEAALWPYIEEGLSGVAFGDIYLQELREYREARLAAVGLRGIFPLWGRDTRELVGEVIRRGIRAVVTTVDAKVLDRSFVGRTLDDAFLADLPAGVDPCGEKGEFHTFVDDGPGFAAPVGWVRSAVTERDGFYYCDLLPTSSGVSEALNTCKFRNKLNHKGSSYLVGR